MQRASLHTHKMGAGDLNSKKSWHPTTYKNLRKVEKREQQVKDEARKVELLRKEKEKEREQEELRRLLAERNDSQASKLVPKVDWMYEQPKLQDKNKSISVVYGSIGSKDGKEDEDANSGPALLLDNEQETFLLGRKPITDLITNGMKSTNLKTQKGAEFIAQQSLPAGYAHTLGSDDSKGRSYLGTMFGGLSNVNQAKDATLKSKEDPMTNARTKPRFSKQSVERSLKGQSNGKKDLLRSIEDPMARVRKIVNAKQHLKKK